MSYFTDYRRSVTASQQEGEMAWKTIFSPWQLLHNRLFPDLDLGHATYATPALPANLITGHSLTDVPQVSFTGHEESTPALTYASTLGTPVDSALQQDYVSSQGSASPFQHQPIVPNNTGPDRFVCLIPGCSVTCSRVSDLDRHYTARHQSPGLKPEFKCRVEGCNRMEIPFTRKDKLREHERNIHYIV
ncbi:hypothetical protein JMJ35_008516 [Cladonia borealis]|uniref:C2H2-type domain-containing protein n=1 Tax=Cladonia borealis TaxID=184061 RepID=A0AA39V6Z4_9LECA|nr:hypothetical protein JMJ35_008516 [Cladonia borealis]